MKRLWSAFKRWLGIEVVRTRADICPICGGRWPGNGTQNDSEPLSRLFGGPVHPEGRDER